jgi:cytoskeleton protein RodZ
MLSRNEMSERECCAEIQAKADEAAFDIISGQESCLESGRNNCYYFEDHGFLDSFDTTHLRITGMNLEQFGEGLKQLRLERKISLMDISTETRINMKFLEAMERGQFQILPQTYVRAFLREYALILGLSPDDLLQRYDGSRQEAPAQKTDESLRNYSHAKPVIGAPESRIFSLSPLQRNIAFGIFILAAIILVIILANLNRMPEMNKPLSEVPFERVIRESEAASALSPAVRIDSMLPANPRAKDSLRLEMTTVDSVWISLLIDGKRVEEYLFGPNKRRTWIAKDRFAVTMGNAGGATFRLNGKSIGSLGRRGAVVRNAAITEANLKN